MAKDSMCKLFRQELRKSLFRDGDIIENGNI